jgi:SAM-dependent methyltransferase
MNGFEPTGAGASAGAEAVLVLHLRASRRRARAAAVAEALGLLEDLEPAAPGGGPLSELGGTAWVTVPRRHLKPALARLGRLGYSDAVDLVEPGEGAGEGAQAAQARGAPAIRWRRRWWRAVRVHQADEAALRERAPDRRPFLLECGDGQVREVRGYRGSGADGARRALPVPDARMLVNLAGPPCGTLLDPFAGAGGIALEAREAGWAVVTADLDPVLRFGLAALGALHLVADARRLPLLPGSVDAVAGEPPYDPDARELPAEVLPELARVLRMGGHLALLVTPEQAAPARQAAAAAGLAPGLDTPIDRKGLDVVALSWTRAGPGSPGGSPPGRSSAGPARPA